MMRQNLKQLTLLTKKKKKSKLAEVLCVYLNQTDNTRKEDLKCF